MEYITFKLFFFVPQKNVLGVQENWYPSTYQRSVKSFTLEGRRKIVLVGHVKFFVRCPRFASCCFLKSCAILHVRAICSIDLWIQIPLAKQPPLTAKHYRRWSKVHTNPLNMERVGNINQNFVGIITMRELEKSVATSFVRAGPRPVRSPRCIIPLVPPLLTREWELRTLIFVEPCSQFFCWRLASPAKVEITLSICSITGSIHFLESWRHFCTPVLAAANMANA